MRIFILSIFIGCMAFGCYYDNEEYLFPELPGDCDTTSVSYTADIQPILSAFCYACHSNLNAASFGNNIKLEDFTDVAEQSSVILSTLKHEQGVSPMPKGGSQLIDCKLITFEAWINQGKLDN